MFIRNSWYVADWSKSFDRSLRSMTILGEQIVFFRTEGGSICALEDACPHRKLPLSMGRLQGDAVECGYHGLTFDGTGKCVNAPTQPGTIPVRAVVMSYPLVERWGLVWIWMGKAELADASLIYEIGNYNNPDWGYTDGGALDIACNYLYITDNLLDPYHVAWVHQTSFAGAGTDSGEPEIEILDDGVLVSRWLYNQAPPPYYADLLKFSGHCDRKQHYECRLPSLAINKSIYSTAGSGGPDKSLPENTYINISYNFITPVDEDNSRYFWFQHRNTDPDNTDISARMFNGAKLAFEEDRDVLVNVHKGMANQRSRNISLHLDSAAARFRAQTRELLKIEAADGDS